jgi:hypothetical protein
MILINGIDRIIFSNNCVLVKRVHSIYIQGFPTIDWALLNNSGYKKVCDTVAVTGEKYLHLVVLL